MKIALRAAVSLVLASMSQGCTVGEPGVDVDDVGTDQVALEATEFDDSYDEEQAKRECIGACGWKCNACYTVNTEFPGECYGRDYVYELEHHKACPSKSCCEDHDICQRMYCRFPFDGDDCVACQLRALFSGCGPCLDGECSGTTIKRYDVWRETAVSYNDPYCRVEEPTPPESDCFEDCYWDWWETCTYCEDLCGYSDCWDGCNSDTGNCIEDDEYY